MILMLVTAAFFAGWTANENRHRQAKPQPVYVELKRGRPTWQPAPQWDDPTMPRRILEMPDDPLGPTFQIDPEF